MLVIVYFTVIEENKFIQFIELIYPTTGRVLTPTLLPHQTFKRSAKHSIYKSMRQRSHMNELLEIIEMLAVKYAQIDFRTYL